MMNLDYSTDVEILDLVAKFKKFLMNNKARCGDVWGGAKKTNFQSLRFLDDSERCVKVCPLCYEAGHKRKDCPEKEDDPILRCFHCNEVGHFKVSCPKRKNKGNGTSLWWKSLGLVDGSNKRCFRCLEVGHFKAMCPKSEGTVKMRCFKCNSEEHLKAQCPLLKTHVSKDKDNKQTTKVGRCVLVNAREDVLVISELEFSKGSENMVAPLACCNNVEANDTALSKSTTSVGEAEGVKIVEYSKIDEINLDGFNLMAESTRQKDACEDVSSLVDECEDQVKGFKGFLKRIKSTTSQDNVCLVAIKENVGRIISLPQIHEEESPGGSSSSTYCASEASHSTKSSKVCSLLTADDIHMECEANFDNTHDAYGYLVEFIVKNNVGVVQLKKERRQLKKELAIFKRELEWWTNQSQANIGASDSFDDFSSKCLDASLDSSKNIVVELEPKNSNLTSDSNEMLGTIKTKDLEIKFLGQRITTLKEKIFLLETEMSNLERKIADECAHASVSPRCEENNVLSDRVKILELENLSLNKVIKNFTSSQQNLNKLVGNLENDSFGCGVGF